MLSIAKPSLAVSLLPLLMALAGDARAQVLYGSLVGAVTDAAQSTVPGATVRISSQGTAQSRETTTDQSGAFTFPSLPGGSYDVTVTKAGFQTFSRKGVNVAA